MLVNDHQVVHNSSVGKNKAVLDMISRNIACSINSRFDGPPGFDERKNQRIPFFEDRCDLG